MSSAAIIWIVILTAKVWRKIVGSTAGGKFMSMSLARQFTGWDRVSSGWLGGVRALLDANNLVAPAVPERDYLPSDNSR